MVANDHPGCCGAAARLPKKPGIQKLTPPSSASELPGTATTDARVIAPQSSPDRTARMRAAGCSSEFEVGTAGFMLAPVIVARPLQHPGNGSERQTPIILQCKCAGHMQMPGMLRMRRVVAKKSQQRNCQ